MPCGIDGAAPAHHAPAMVISGIWDLPAVGGMDWALGPGGTAILLLAMFLDVFIGDPRWLPHPVRAIGLLIAWLDAKLNRPKRGEVDRMLRGFVAVVAVVGGASVVGWLLGLITRDLPFGWCIEFVVVALMIAQRSMVDHVVRVMRGLDKNGVNGGRSALKQIVGRDVSKLDEHGVSRAAIESVAESFTDGVVAPVFWYLLLGLPGLFAFKAISTLDSMIGYRTERHASFGMVAARLDDVANWIPARIAGLLMVVAALFTPSAAPLSALRVMLRDSGKHASPNAGWTEAAMAGALGLALLGPRKYAGAKETKNMWIGDGRAKVTRVDVRLSLLLFAISCLLVAGVVAIIGVAAQFGGAR